VHNTAVSPTSAISAGSPAAPAAVACPTRAATAGRRGNFSTASPVETKMDDDAARKKFNDMLKLSPPE
jgi:hypothetical protein